LEAKEKERPKKKLFKHLGARGCGGKLSLIRKKKRGVEGGGQGLTTQQRKFVRKKIENKQKRGKEKRDSSLNELGGLGYKKPKRKEVRVCIKKRKNQKRPRGRDRNGHTGVEKVIWEVSKWGEKGTNLSERNQTAKKKKPEKPLRKNKGERKRDINGGGRLGRGKGKSLCGWEERATKQTMKNPNRKPKPSLSEKKHWTLQKQKERKTQSCFAGLKNRGPIRRT